MMAGFYTQLTIFYSTSYFVPFFFYDRTLFIHHYLTAYIYKLMLTAFILTHVHQVACSIISTWKRLIHCVFLRGLFVWLVLIVYVFAQLSALAYGIYPLTADDVRALRWKDTWDLIIHKA